MIAACTLIRGTQCSISMFLLGSGLADSVGNCEAQISAVCSGGTAQRADRIHPISQAFFSPRKSFCFVLCIVICASGTATVALLIARDLYIQAKVIAALPSQAERYAESNFRLNAKTRKRIVLFGDSRISNWEPLPALQSIEFVNRGIGGETSAQLRSRFASDVLALDPDVIIIQVGINDIVAASLDPVKSAQIIEHLKLNLLYFLTSNHSAGIEVIVMTIVRPASPPLIRRIVWSNRIFDLVREVNSYLTTLDLPANAHVFDSDSIFNHQDGPLDPSFASDTLHWSTKAYEQLNIRLSAYF